MKLPKVLDALEDVEEKFRVFYVEDGEKFKLGDLSIDGYVAEKEVTGLRQNRDDILTEFKTFKKKFDGVDPEEFKKLREAVAADQKKKTEKTGDHDAIVRQLNEDHEKKQGLSNEKITALEKDIRTVMIDNVATAALAKAKGNVNVLRPHVKDACRCVQDDDGTWRVEVLGDDGRPRVSPGKATDLMSIGELVDEMKGSEDFAPNFEGDGATGGGAAGGKSGGSRGVILRGDQRKDVAAYREAKARAEKIGGEVQLQE